MSEDWSPRFRAAAAAAVGLPPGRARQRAREAWLRAIRADARLTASARLAAHELAAALIWRCGYARIGLGELARRIGRHRDSARRAIRALAAAELVVRHIERREGSAEAETALTALLGLVEACGQTAVCPQGVGVSMHPGRCTDAPGVGVSVHPGRCTDAPGGRCRNAAESSESVPGPPLYRPLTVPLPRRSATTGIEDDLGDRGLTELADSAQPQPIGPVPAERPAGSAGRSLPPGHRPPEGLWLPGGQLPLECPRHLLGPDVEARVRARGMELDAVWAHLHQRNARRLARGRGPLQIDDLAAYIVGTAARMARERLGPADRDALAAYRAARGPARPSGGRGP